jgi:TRAP-type transport system periplasmic protein
MECQGARSTTVGGAYDEKEQRTVKNPLAGATGMVAGVALSISLLGAPGAVAAEKTVRFGWVTPDTPMDPYAITGRTFKERVEANTGGAVEVQLFPNRQLGDEKEILEGVRFGTIEAAVITNAVVANVERALQVNDLPFLYANEAQAHGVLDGEPGQELLGLLSAKGIIGLRFCEGGFRNMINNVRPVAKPADVAGVKYRVMENPVYVGMYKALGGNAVPMAWAEVFSSVQQGALDGLEIPVMIVNATKMYEITKYLSMTNHTYSAIVLVMSKRFFDKLTPAQQQAVREAAVQTCDEQRKQNAQNVAKTIEALKEKGMQVNAVDDPAAFRTLVNPVYEEFRPSIGSERLDRFLSAVN